MKDKVDGAALGPANLGGPRAAVPNDPVAGPAWPCSRWATKPQEVSKLVQAVAETGDSAETIIRKGAEKRFAHADGRP